MLKSEFATTAVRAMSDLLSAELGNLVEPALMVRE
jgi:hypothetical protein